MQELVRIAIVHLGTVKRAGSIRLPSYCPSHHYLLFPELESMNTDQNVTVGVHLQQVPVDRVKPEAAHRKRRIVFELIDLGRIAHLHQFGFDQIEAQRLVLGRLVLGQRVIHVEAIELDVLQMQRSIHKDSEMARQKIGLVMGKQEFYICKQ